MDDQGIIVKCLVKVFGRSWKTSVLGIMMILPQILHGVQVWLVDLGMSTSTLNSISVLFGALAAMAAKAHDVTGTSKTE